MESVLDPRIVEFIGEHHVLTLCTVADGLPYCANCFYVFLEAENTFVFATHSHTKHGTDMLKTPRVAASIMLETKTVGKIQGLQLCGTVQIAEESFFGKAHRAYLAAFPFAVVAQAELWLLKMDYAKFTDNRLGFGKKIIWGELPTTA